MPVALQDVDLTGLVDMHIHTAPDVRPRLLDDIDAARQAAEAGMRAIVLKSHVTCTAGRAAIAQKVVEGVRVCGGIALNEAVGGLNPAAVEAALGMGARVVWMPTLSARNHIVKHGGEPSGISLVTEDGELDPALFVVLDLIRQHDAVLATGHVSVFETWVLLRSAAVAGVRKAVVTHPEVPWVDMPNHVQQELRDRGVYFERCFVSSLAEGGGVPFSRIVSAIREVGIASTILTTDFGLDGIPSPVEGMRAYVGALLAEGFSERDIQLMAGETPADLLELG